MYVQSSQSKTNMKTTYPNGPCDLEEQKLFKVRLAEHAEEAGCTVEEYIKDSKHRYVLLSNADQPEHWTNEDEFDETDWCVYESRDEAENERQLLISEGDYGHRVVTERYFLKMKGLI